MKLRLVIAWVLGIIAFTKEDRVDEAVKYAYSFIHTPYVYGGNGAGFNNSGTIGYGGFDCSGFVIGILQAFGVSLWQMIEAGGGDSHSTCLENSTGFVRLRPLNWRNDLVAVLMPPW